MSIIDKGFKLKIAYKKSQAFLISSKTINKKETENKQEIALTEF